MSKDRFEAHKFNEHVVWDHAQGDTVNVLGLAEIANELVEQKERLGKQLDDLRWKEGMNHG